MCIRDRYIKEVCQEFRTLYDNIQGVTPYLSLIHIFSAIFSLNSVAVAKKYAIQSETYPTKWLLFLSSIQYFIKSPEKS